MKGYSLQDTTSNLSSGERIHSLGESSRATTVSAANIQDPLKDPKKRNPPKMTPITILGNFGDS